MGSGLTPITQAAAAALFLVFSLVLGGAMAGAPSAVAAPGKLDAAALVREAVEQSPAIREARQRLAASEARVAGQGLYQDPMLETGLMSLRGFMGPQVSVAQTFPLGGKLEAERTVAAAEVAVARQELRMAINNIQAEVQRTYYDLYVLQQAAEIIDRNRQLLRQTAKIASTRYAVGQGRQSDVIRTSAQVAEMLREAILVRKQRENLYARLRGQLNWPIGAGQPNDIVIPTPATPTFGRSATALMALATRRNPALLKSEAEVVLGMAVRDAARTTAIPDVTTRVGLGQAYMDMGWQTVVSGMVSTNLPVSSQQRASAAVAAAESEIAARRAALEQQRRDVAVALQQTLTTIRHLAEQLRLYGKGLLPQARLAIQSELANYRVGRSEFDAVLAAQMGLYRYESEYNQTLADYQKMLVEIAFLTAEAVPDAEETL